MIPKLVRFALVVGLVLSSGTYLPATHAAAATGAPYAFAWSGTPLSPQPWNPVSGFDVVIHDRDYTQTYDRPYSFSAMHGSDCGPFAGFGVGGTHTVSTYQDSVFVCNNHLMTGINGQGYGEIAFTPAELLDWSQGPVTATWQVDTLRTSCRDWLSFNVMPFADNLLVTDGIGVDLYHEPKNELMFTTGASCGNNFTGTDIRNFAEASIPGPGGAVEDVVDTTSALAAKNRQTFELDISSTHVRFGMPAFNKWFVDGDLRSPLPYSQAVLQFEQHSYTPDKECNPSATFCAANTWHWSNIAISNGVPFTILRADRFQVAGGHVADGIPDTVSFSAPAPANSFLRFEAVAGTGSVRFSTDGGQTWITPTHQQPSQNEPSGALTDGQTCLYFWPIPAGATQVKFQAADTYWTRNAIRNISIWSTAPGSGVVNGTPPPAPAPVPTVAPSDVPITGTAPTPTPVPIFDVPSPTPAPAPKPGRGRHGHRLLPPLGVFDAIGAALDRTPLGPVAARLEASSPAAAMNDAAGRLLPVMPILPLLFIAGLLSAGTLLMRTVRRRRQANRTP
jgi:hypothetical protein